MTRTGRVAGWLCVAVLTGGAAAAQELFIFPNDGQDQAQQDKDRAACHVWAVNQTGFDPAFASATPPPSREARQGGLLRGGARGAALGAAVGAIGGDAGRGAENGRGWSLVVDKGTGDMTLAIAGDDLGFVLFGVCQKR